MSTDQQDDRPLRPLGAAEWTDRLRASGREEARNTLAAWGLVHRQDVEVELLVLGGAGAVPGGPRLVEGVITGATGNVLVIETRQGVVRVAWQAVATIRDRVTTPPHPAL